MDPAIERHLRDDPVMARLIETHGPVTIEPAPDPFRRLCVSIVNQQLSTASASAIRNRVFALLDDEVTPETVLAADETDLREAGLSSTKIEYLRSAADSFREKDYSRAALAEYSNDEIRAELTRIRGIGTWTAEMYLIFVMGREDVLPLGDLAIRRGIERLYGNGAELTRDGMREAADAWRPYRSYGTRYVWLEYEAE